LPLHHEQLDDHPHFLSIVIRERTRDKLVSSVGALLLGDRDHAESILDQIDDPSGFTYSRGELDRLKERLAFPPHGQRTPAEKALSDHRDGWLFQMISWVALREMLGQEALLRAPHAAPAQHGFDGLGVTFSKDGIAMVILCEDKASTAPRKKVREEVWVEIESIEQGRHDSAIRSSLVALLREGYSPLEVRRLVQDLQWHEQRAYRVSLCVRDSQVVLEARSQLLKDFENKAKGDRSRRIGVFYPVDSLRPWFDRFAVDLIQRLDSNV
jgi:hypothetical protein